jgi:hypothetical protein
MHTTETSFMYIGINEPLLEIENKYRFEIQYFFLANMLVSVWRLAQKKCQQQCSIIMK